MANSISITANSPPFKMKFIFKQIISHFYVEQMKMACGNLNQVHNRIKKAR